MKKTIIVTGVPRSGTSLLCQALERLGVAFGEPLIPADTANPWGYYENRRLVELLTFIVHDWCKPQTWLHDGPLTMKNVSSTRRDELVRYLSEQKSPFCWKTPFACRIPQFIEEVLGEADFEPVYVHAIREPDEVYWSILKANDTYPKNTSQNWHFFLGVWARMVMEARQLEPRAEVWYEDWKKVGAQETLDKLSEALWLPRGSATDLLKDA